MGADVFPHPGVPCRIPDASEQAANAALLIAAPHLLAALREALLVMEWTAAEMQLSEERCDCETLSDRSTDVCSAHGCLTAKIIDARAAIAKATGESA